MATDLAFEAMCEVCSISWQKGERMESEVGRVNAALKELRAIYPDDVTLPAMIRERAEAWAVCYPEIPPTPQALTGNWSRILSAAEGIKQQAVARASANRNLANAHARRGCTVCMDDHYVIVGTDAAGNDVVANCWGCNGGRMPEGWGRM